jgi:hypothetical protein
LASCTVLRKLKARERRPDHVDDRNEERQGSAAFGQQHRPLEPPQLMEIESLKSGSRGS